MNRYLSNNIDGMKSVHHPSILNNENERYVEDGFFGNCSRFHKLGECSYFIAIM